MTLMIEARDLTKRYGSVRAIDKVSFTIDKGEVVGFLGPNGAGKTTTMKILTCFIAPTTGNATVNGANVFDDSLKVRRAIGYLPESTPLYGEMLVLEYLEFVARMRQLEGKNARTAIAKAVTQTGLGDRLGQPIRELSKGFKQRVGLAQALVHSPPVLILDEPMSGLDPNQATEIRELIKSIGKERTVILSTHNLAEVQMSCSRVLIISRGRIVADDKPEALTAGAAKARFTVDVAKNGKSSDALKELFGKIKGVSGVEVGAGGDDEVALVLLGEGDADLRAEIFKAAVEGKVTLLGLRREKQNLEAIFRDLTTGPANEPAYEDDDEDEGDDEDEESDADEGDEDNEDDEDEEKADEKDDAKKDDGEKADAKKAEAKPADDVKKDDAPKSEAKSDEKKES